MQAAQAAARRANTDVAASAAEAVMAIRSMRKDVDHINVATSGLEIVDRICVTSDAGAAAVHRKSQ